MAPPMGLTRQRMTRDSSRSRLASPPGRTFQTSGPLPRPLNGSSTMRTRGRMKSYSSRSVGSPCELGSYAEIAGFGCVPGRNRRAACRAPLRPRQAACRPRASESPVVFSSGCSWLHTSPEPGSTPPPSRPSPPSCSYRQGRSAGLPSPSSSRHGVSVGSNLHLLVPLLDSPGRPP